ncbi:MAG: PAS domain S-box protein [Deltaproteobacteria bacterium]|nr:PAS domain S-box protein [Deltaproteobacteria bacterium]
MFLKAKLSRALEQSACLVAITDTNGDIVYVNHKFCEMTGYAAEELIGRKPRMLKSGDLSAQVYRQLWDTITAGGEWQGEFHNRKKDGERFWTLATISPIRNWRGEITHFIAVQEDITERKRTEEALRESEEKYRFVVEFSPDIICVHQDERIVFVNHAGLSFMGLEDAAGAYGRSVFDFIHEDYHDLVRESIEKLLAGVEESPILELKLVRPDGGTVDVEAMSSPFIHENRPAIHAIIRDITARKGVEVQLRHVSTHDMLTGLYNRAFFEEEMKRLARGRQFPVSIVSADLDGLKSVNDSLGHEAGDRLLQTAAQVLIAAFRAEDMVARIGGDEFAVLLPGADANAAEEAVKRIRKCQDDANRANNEFSVTISLGAATAESEEDLSHAFKLSDERMYKEKFRRKGIALPGQPAQARDTGNEPAKRRPSS